MSIIVKCTPNLGTNGGGKGFPPGEVNIINHVINNQQVWVKWQDPDDTVIDNVIIAQWKGTILVRNNNHYPEHIKDGIIVVNNTVKNRYKDAWFIDNELINNHIYYYRFFTYSTSDTYDNSSSTIFNDTPSSYNPIFRENSWHQINSASESGDAPFIWKIGDEIDIQLSGELNETMTLQIWDFNWFDKTDGSGKAGLVLGCKNLLEGYYCYTLDHRNILWRDSDMRVQTMSKIYNSMDTGLQKVIKDVNTRTLSRDGLYDYYYAVNTDKVFIPSLSEARGKQSSNDPEGKEFAIFTDNNSRIKKNNNGLGDAVNWCTRSHFIEASEGNERISVISVRGEYALLHYSGSAGLCFCFCV